MDKTDLHIIEILQKDARISMKDLGKIVGLTAPAASQRVKKMEQMGIIKGYSATIDFSKLGKKIQAFVSLSIPYDDYNSLIEFARSNNSIIECYHVTGRDSLIFKVMVKDIIELEKLIDNIKIYSNTNTSVILSSPINNKMIELGS